MSITGTPSAAPAVPEPAPAQDRPEPSRAERAAPERIADPQPVQPVVEPVVEPEPVVEAPTAEPTAEPAVEVRDVAAPSPGTSSAPAAPVSPPAPSGGLSLADIRRLWPEVIEVVQRKRRVTWMHVSQNSQVVGYEGTVLTLGFRQDGPRRSFESGGHAEIVQEALRDVIGADVRVEAIVDPGADAGAAPPAPRTQPAEPDGPPAWAAAEPEPPPQPEPPVSRRPPPEAFAPEQAAAAPEPVHDPDAAVDLDDAEADHESGAELLARELGAQVIEEIPRS
jgi:DNA polymerase-3 subunit gamma/tau